MEKATIIQNWLAIAVERLRDATNLEQVILFGSWARGTATRRSDLDLLIVLHTKEPPLVRIGQVLQLLRDSPCDLDVIVYTPEELKNLNHRPFIQQILREGTPLYEFGKTIF